MDDKTIQILNALAEKLGTTSQYLWGVLLKQAPISGVVSLLSVSAIIIAAVLWCRFVKMKTTKPLRTEENHYPSADWSDEGAELAWISVAIVILLASIATISGINSIVAALFNPEYWALKQIWH